MKFKIEIDVSGDAFQENPSAELITCLEVIRLRLEHNSLLDIDGKPIFDSNGNTVGKLTLKGKK